MSNIKIVNTETSHLASIQEIYDEITLNSLATYDYKGKTIGEMEEWFRDKETQNWPVFTLFLGSEVAGFATYGSFRTREGYKKTVELTLHLHKKFRNQGLGTKLLDHLINHAKQSGCHNLISGMDASNKVSIALHKKLGFYEVGRIPKVAHKFGKWGELLLLSKIV